MCGWVDGGGKRVEDSFELVLLLSDICKARYGAEGFSSPMRGMMGCLKRVSHWWRCVSILSGLMD